MTASSATMRSSRADARWRLRRVEFGAAASWRARPRIEGEGQCLTRDELERVIDEWLAPLPHCDAREHEVLDLVDRIVKLLADRGRDLREAQ